MSIRRNLLSTTPFVLAMLCGVADGAYAQDVKIGVNEPLTDAFAASGTYVVNGAKIAADELNAKGGVLGKKIQLVVEDNKSSPTEAAAVAEKLITEDKVPVMMGAWGSTLTLAVMPKLMEYHVPMLVETSSSGKITTSGNPYIFRISPPSSVEAAAFKSMIPKLGIKKVDFLVINNDWGLGAAQDFGKVLKSEGVKIGLDETFDQSATDMSAQLEKIKASDSDTVMVTCAVDQLVLIFKQAAALGLKKKIITTGGSQNPDQLVEQAGAAANNTMHLATFVPWYPEMTPYPEITKYFLSEWKKRGYQPAGDTEGFRGYDGIRTIAAAIQLAGKADPEAIQKAFWKVDVKGLNGDIKFQKSGPAGEESGQSQPKLFLIKIQDGKIVVPKL